MFLISDIECSVCSVDNPCTSFDRCHFYCIYLFAAESLIYFVLCFVCGKILLYVCIEKFCNSSYFFTAVYESNPFFWCYESACVFYLCFFWGRNLFKFMSYSLLCSMFLMVLFSTFFTFSVYEYVCNRFNM
jgi:hypothetical protein